MEVRSLVRTRRSFFGRCVHTLPTYSYFRHWLNWVILYSVWFEFDLMPFVILRLLDFERCFLISLYSGTSKRWSPEDGVWMVSWMKYQVFAPLVLLQALNLFWYFLIWRIAVRYARRPVIATSGADDMYIHQGREGCGRL